MQECPSCGNKISEIATACPHCGRVFGSQQPAYRQTTSASSHVPEELSGSDQALVFCGNICFSPILGIVLYLVWKDEKPHKAEQVCNLTIFATLAGIAISFVFAMLRGS